MTFVKWNGFIIYPFIFMSRAPIYPYGLLIYILFFIFEIPRLVWVYCAAHLVTYYLYYQ